MDGHLDDRPIGGSLPLDGVGSAVPSFQLHPVFGIDTERVPPNDAMSRFVGFCARRWGDRRLEASHYDLKRVKSVRNCAAHGSCLINCFAERGAARGSASSGVSRRVAAVGIPKATRRKWMGNTAMQEVATVLVAQSGLVPEGSSRSRAASELAEMFARADGETEALPDKGPDAAARSALEFLRRLTESLGLVE